MSKTDSIRSKLKSIPEFRSWWSMIYRCKYKSRHDYQRYGGRGVTVCERWSDFDAFLKDMGPKPSPHHSLDRIDGNGNYEPSNCRWATATEQSRNRRGNHYLEFNGERLTITEWALRIGIDRTSLLERISTGWSVEKALTTPRVPQSESGRRGCLSPKRIRKSAK